MSKVQKMLQAAALYDKKNQNFRSTRVNVLHKVRLQKHDYLHSLCETVERGEH